MKRHFANMVFALILAAYTVYAALDTFMIVRVLTPDTLRRQPLKPPPRRRKLRPPRRLRRNPPRNRRPPRPFPPTRNTTTTKSTLC